MKNITFIFYVTALIFLFSCEGAKDNNSGTTANETSETGLYEQYSSSILSLNGTWEIAQGNMRDIPAEFDHQVKVPGLVSQADPPFKEVGLPSEIREAFWYKTSFELDKNAAPNVFLKIYKAKYGTGVYVNGELAGENMLNFTPTLVNITPYLNSEGADNELIIRIGAHIESLPDTVVTAGEVEKFRYMPGIYDYVELILSEHIFFSSVQVATFENEVKIEAEISNNGPANSAVLQANIRNFSKGEVVGTYDDESLTFNRDEIRNINLTIPVEDPVDWTPENPQLYLLELKAGDETYTTRFGFRNFKLDSSYTNMAYLNGERYFFRGTNISLFRFFEDPVCENQPWDPEWVRGLFRKFKSLGMNSARTTLCSFPKFWYEIADEEGFALFAEYPIWYALKQGVSHMDYEEERTHPQRKYGIYPEKLTTERLINEYTHWMKDLWNHASVIAWDAQNETWTKATGEAIEEVRDLDMSDRPWDNGWSPPVSPSDFREAHPYFARYNVGSESENVLEKVPEPFKLEDLAFEVKIPGTLYSPYQYAYDLPLNNYLDQPCLINEYAYLWLNRDGTPTTLTQPYYDAVLGPDASPDRRREHYAYMLAALTEYWRSVRTCFGVLHVFGLSHSLPEGATSDNFIDINSLEFDRHFQEYVPQAFNPLGICIENWFVEIKPGEYADLPMVITNDLGNKRTGTIRITLSRDGKTIQQEKKNFQVDPYGQNRIWIRLQMPEAKGNYVITATAQSENETIRSLRKIDL